MRWAYKLQLHAIPHIDNWNEGIEIPSTLILETSRKVIIKKQFSVFLKKAENKCGVLLNKKIGGNSK